MGARFAKTRDGMVLTDDDAADDVHDLGDNTAGCMWNPKSYVGEVDGMDEVMNFWSVRGRMQIGMVNVIM